MNARQVQMYFSIREFIICFFHIGITWIFRETSKGYQIGYAHSNDLYDWKRNDSIAGIEKSDVGWDSESVSYPHVFELDNKILMLYQGNEMGKFGFGLAELNNTE